MIGVYLRNVGAATQGGLDGADFVVVLLVVVLVVLGGRGGQVGTTARRVGHGGVDRRRWLIRSIFLAVWMAQMRE